MASTMSTIREQVFKIGMFRCCACQLVSRNGNRSNHPRNEAKLYPWIASSSLPPRNIKCRPRQARQELITPRQDRIGR